MGKNQRKKLRMTGENNNNEPISEFEAGQRIKWFHDACLPLYRESDTSRFSKKLLTAINEYTVTPQGLGFVGKPGECKTRAMFILLRRLIMDDGVYCKAVSTPKFATLCANQFSDNFQAKEDAEKKMKSFQSCDVLFIDDLGKNKMTERAEVELYDLLETRTGKMIPTLWTANAASGELLAMFSKDRGEAILRRLAEFSKVISL